MRKDYGARKKLLESFQKLPFGEWTFVGKFKEEQTAKGLTKSLQTARSDAGINAHEVIITSFQSKNSEEFIVAACRVTMLPEMTGEKHGHTYAN
ncbi:MAG: hypothetical protein ACRCYY_17610 [Trueperaceae bacterium]